MSSQSGYDAFPVMGLSARAIAGGGTDHPHDPDDLLRCVRYCAGRYTTAALQARMKGRSQAWDRLLPHWDHLVGLLAEEMGTRTDQCAPRTYFEMRRILADGSACLDCDQTGRGDECVKCKGTGRRGGGRCRAPRCYGGASFCAKCGGKGFTVIPKETKA